MIRCCIVILAALHAAPVHAEDLRRRGFIGVQVVEVPDESRRQLALPPGVGVLVQSLVDGGSAKAAGVKPQDVILQVGDRRVSGIADFVALVGRLRAGDAISLLVRRETQTVAVPVPVRPRPLEQAPDVDVHYDAVTVDGSLRRTIVTAPRKPGRQPAILYLNGIGCFSQESMDLASNDAKLLYGLTRAGYVTMRVEKSGEGDSEGPSCNSPQADFHAELRAYTAGLRAIKQLPYVDANAVFLMGVSIGGVEAPLVAAQERVQGVVVINTVAKPLFEYLIDSRRRQMILARREYDDVDRRMQVDERCNHRLLIAKEPPDEILRTSPECSDHIAYPAPFTFMQQWADVNIAAAWKAVDRPVLVAYGTSDFVSSIADDAYLADVINAFHPGAATVTAVPGMDHGMSRASSMEESFSRRTPTLFADGVLDVVVSWLAGIKGR